MQVYYISARDNRVPISGALVIKKKPQSGLYSRALVSTNPDLIQVILQYNADVVDTITDLIYINPSDNTSPTHIDFYMSLNRTVDYPLYDETVVTLGTFAPACVEELIFTRSIDLFKMIQDLYGWIGEFQLINDKLYVKELLLDAGLQIQPTLRLTVETCGGSID